MQDDSPYNSNKKKFLKIKNKKVNKKKLFPELSFVEAHQETFYCLNENVMATSNPLQAKIVDVNDIDQIAKNWVF